MPIFGPANETKTEPTPDQNINALGGIFVYIEGMTFVKAPENYNNLSFEL
jgi:hypothetical protein